MVVCLAGNFNQLQQLSQEKGIPVPMMSADTLRNMKRDDPASMAHVADITGCGAQAAVICDAFESLANYIEAVRVDRS